MWIYCFCLLIISPIVTLIIRLQQIESHWLLILDGLKLHEAHVTHKNSHAINTGMIRLSVIHHLDLTVSLLPTNNYETFKTASKWWNNHLTPRCSHLVWKSRGGTSFVWAEKDNGILIRTWEAWLIVCNAKSTIVLQNSSSRSLIYFLRLKGTTSLHRHLCLYMSVRYKQNWTPNQDSPDSGRGTESAGKTQNRKSGRGLRSADVHIRGRQMGSFTVRRVLRSVNVTKGESGRRVRWVQSKSLPEFPE